MSTKFLSPNWRMPRNANQSKQSNYSLDFEGESSSSYIDSNFIPANNLTGNFTISAWVYSDNITGGIGVDFICGVENYTTPRKKFGFGLYNNNSPQYYYMFGSTSAIGATISNNPKNTWTHLTVTYDGANLKFYSNGTLDSTVSVGVLSDYSTSNMYIGARNKVDPTDSATDFFNGKMTELCIFDYDLSSSQVTTLWGGGTSASNPMALPSPPKAYYPLGGSAGAFQTPVNNNDKWLIENNAIGDYVFSLPQDATVSTLNNFFNSTNFPDGFTASVWVKNWAITGSGAAPQNVFFDGANATNRFELYSSYSSESGFKVWLNVNSTPLYSNSANSLHWSDNTKWVNLVVTWDRANGTLVLYSNGQAGTINTSAPTSWGASNTNTTIFGNSANQSGNVLTSNYQMWNVALSSTEVETLYSNGSPIRTLANIPQNSNLKAWYKLDASEIYNSSTTEWEVNQATADYASSLSFPGVVGDLLKIPNSSTFIPTSNLTLSFWVNHTLPSGSPTDRDPRVFSIPKDPNNEGLYLMDDTNGTLRFTISSSAGNSDTSTAIAVNDGKWHNIVCTWDASGNIKVYTDNGTPSTNTNTGTLTIPASTDMGIGGKFTGTETRSKFTGLISNGSVWNKALSASEVSEVYNSGQPGNLSSHNASSNLVAWWKMDNLGNGIQDSSTNSNNGTAFDLSVQPGSVSTLNGESSGMSQTNLVQSDLQTVAPYSKYAMNFDGTDYINIGTGGISTISSSLSIWFKTSSTAALKGFFGIDSTSLDYYISLLQTGSNTIQFYDGSSMVSITPVINDGNWHNLVVTYNHGSSLFKAYTDGAETYSATYSQASGMVFKVIGATYGINRKWIGDLSNASLWSQALTFSQVREIYNQGLPSDLSSHSAVSLLTGWWQLGENSSYVSGWTFADEIGSNNGDGIGLPETALVNGVGTTANGTSSGMGVEALVGDAPYSTGNAMSSGMAVTARGTNVP